MRTFSFTALAAVFCLMLFMTVSASDIIASGTGWTLDDDGTLSIVGRVETEFAEWREYAPQIKEILLTKDVGGLPESPFLGCTSLTAITVEAGNPTFFSDAGGALCIGNDEIFHSVVAYPAANPAKEYVLPENLKNIAPYAFADARFLESVTLHGDMNWILDYAFRNCSALTEVNVPENMAVHCYSNVFEGCTALDSAFVEDFCWNQVFYDVNPGDKYFNAVKYVHKAGLFKGISDYDFAPDSPMTRAMFVTVLGRLAEMQNFYTDENLVWVSFEDVEDDQWYTYYVNWAVTNDIVKGYGNGYFGVNDNVTIEQAAVILYRYAKMIETPAYDMEADYTDTDGISAWAEDAMRWVTATDIYDGYDGGELRPKQNAPRALVAEMLYNYVHKTETPDEIPEKKISEVENPDWGLTLTASDVTSTEMTLTFTQSGGNPTGEYLMSGWYYFIEVFKDGQWTKVEPIKEVNAWVDEGWKIPLGHGLSISEVSWKPLYGALPAGQYRMGKRVQDVRGPGDYDYATFYAEFTVE